MDINQLNKVPLFDLLPEDEAQSLMDAFHARDYPAGATLFEEGDSGESFAIDKYPLVALTPPWPDWSFLWPVEN